MRKRVALLLLVLGGCSNDPPAAETDTERPAPINSTTPPAVRASKAAPAPQGNVSRFTTGGIEKCRVVEKNEEEGPYYRHRCRGVGGYDYEIVEHDLRQSLVFIAPDGRRSDVGLNGTAGGGGFSVLGPTFDWRGPVAAPPKTVTVRFNVDDDAEPGSADMSYLVVIKLAPPSCPIGVVPPGAGQSEKARAIADAETSKCLS